MPTPGPDDTSLTRLSVLDWIGVLVVGGSGLLSLLVPLLVVPIFRRLSESLGATAPSLASSVLQGWTPVALGLFPVALVAYALGVRQPLIRRRLLLVLAFAVTVLASAVLLIALYGTLFNMAGAPMGP
ncbi:MAG TPA: hypothetical protein VMT11_08015 [Myxococcaceae bacterium]|nr:hypothetical protein [Myxococcaceae bacterium]